MLPKNYLMDDKKWIAEQLSLLPYDNIVIAIAGYDKAFLEAGNAEPMEHRKVGAARTAANNRLRRYVERVNVSNDNE